MAMTGPMAKGEIVYKMYRALTYGLSPLLQLHLRWCKIRGLEHSIRWHERFGRPFLRRPSCGPILWFHVVSVGEGMAATPAIKFCSQRRPDVNILMTTTKVSALLLTMATSSLISHPSLLPTKPLTIHRQNQYHNTTTFRNRTSFKVLAAKLPAGVEVPKVEPKFKAPFLGFTRTAEIWNSRACMIGIIGVFIVELIMNKGILQTIGVDVGKGLDIPL